MVVLSPSVAMALRIGADQQDDPGQHHGQGQPLPHADDFRQPEDTRIRRPEVFGDETQAAIADQENAGDRAARAGAR